MCLENFCLYLKKVLVKVYEYLYNTEVVLIFGLRPSGFKYK